MLQAELKILGGKHQGKLISLNTKKFLVGREQDCHLRPNSDLVSRHHCVFSIDDYAVRLRDLGSTNGTFVNGQPLRGEILLKAGDRVSIGKLELEVVLRHSSSKSDPPTPAPTPKSQPVLSTAEISTQSENMDTSDELETMQASTANATVTGAAEMIPADTAIIDNLPANQTVYQQPAVAGYPPAFPPMMPPGYPMPGAYPPAQFPQYPPAGYGAIPGYGQPMGYPPMGYPQMMPAMPPSYPSAAVAPVETAEPPAAENMAVKLPKPEETGAQPVAPPAAAAPGAAGAKKEEKPSNSAADIIKQYMSRRS